jgi:hypothetical protein
MLYKDFVVAAGASDDEEEDDDDDHLGSMEEDEIIILEKDDVSEVEKRFQVPFLHHHLYFLVLLVNHHLIYAKNCTVRRYPIALSIFTTCFTLISVPYCK